MFDVSWIANGKHQIAFFNSKELDRANNFAAKLILIGAVGVNIYKYQSWQY